MNDMSLSAKVASPGTGALRQAGVRFLVAALAVFALGVYVVAQYGDTLQRVMQKVPVARDVMPSILVLAIVPAVVAMPFAALFVEWLFVGWDKSSLRKLLTGNRNSLRDLTYTVIGLLPIQFFLKVFFSLGLVYVAERHITPLVSWNIATWLPVWPLQYVCVVVAGSFFQYWQHRILHTVPLLWETHKLHHSATEMNVLNLNRESPFTTAVADLLIFVPLAIFGTIEMSARGGNLGAADYFFMVLFFCFSVFNVLNHYLIHSEWRTTYGWLGRWIFISPSAHRVHHSIQPQYWNKNFSVTLVIWDRLFGTWEEGKSEEAANTPIGYPDNIYNKGNPLLDYFWLPWREFAKAIARRTGFRSAA